MNYSTPISDRVEFMGEPLSADELIICDRKCNISRYEPYLVNNGDGAIIMLFDFGTEIYHNRYFAIEKSNYYKYFLIGFSLFSDGGWHMTNISSLPSDDLNIAVNVLKEYISTKESGKSWHVKGVTPLFSYSDLNEEKE